PLLRPLIGMDKLEITDQARALGTFETSIEPDAVCCTLFVPKHPGTRMSREEAASVESRLDVSRLIPAGDAGALEEASACPPGGPFTKSRWPSERDADLPRRCRNRHRLATPLGRRRASSAPGLRPLPGAQGVAPAELGASARRPGHARRRAVEPRAHRSFGLS